MLKLWFSCLPESVVPPELYDAMLRTQRHRGHEARVAGIHSVLRQCEHRVLQVLYPLMEVRPPVNEWSSNPETSAASDRDTKLDPYPSCTRSRKWALQVSDQEACVMPPESHLSQDAARQAVCAACAKHALRQAHRQESLAAVRGPGRQSGLSSLPSMYLKNRE